MPRTHDPVLDRLAAELRSGRFERPNALFANLDKAKHGLRAPLRFVPAGTIVTMSVEVPDNLGGKAYRLGWAAGDSGLSVEEARLLVVEQLVDRFFNLVMPLPD